MLSLNNISIISNDSESCFFCNSEAGNEIEMKKASQCSSLVELELIDTELKCILYPGNK